MRHERATEELRELAALYAMGSLTQHEAESLELHLKDGCTVCEAELRKCRSAAGAIAFSVDEIPAPEYVRDLLGARIEREPQVRTDKADKVTEPEVPTRKPQASPPPLSILKPIQKERTPLFIWVLLAALAVTAAIAISTWNAEKRRNRELRADLSAADANAGDLKILLDNHRKKTENLEQILRTVSKPGTRIAHLRGQPADPVSLAAVVWDAEEKQCLVLGSFVAAPEGKSYQLWLLTPGARIPAGMIKTNPAGGTFARLPIPQEAANAVAAMLTIEPETGSQVPTLPYYAVGRIN